LELSGEVDDSRVGTFVEVIDGDVERTNDDIVGLRDRYIIGIKEG
jgi:hypothetical protein